MHEPFALLARLMILSEKFGPLEVQNRTTVHNFNAGLFREDGTQCPPSLLPTLSPKLTSSCCAKQQVKFLLTNRRRRRRTRLQL